MFQLSGMIVAVVFGVALVLILLFVVAQYNGLVGLKNRIKNAWAQIDVQLQRRLDLIPNLVETVKGYATHERGTFDAVAEARSAVMNAKTPAEVMEADNVLTGALKSLFAVSEAYPELKANTNFLQLQRELSDTEDKISYMRQSYNDVVMRYNNQVQMFPSNIVANIFGFKEEQSFEADRVAAQAPQVSF